jgi:hypothetical protein
MKRRDFITGVAAGISAMAVAPTLSTAVPLNPASRGRLAEPAFRPLPLGSITAEGWLQRQMRLQAEGLSGHLDVFWPDVAQSQWFGGKAEGWERAPYWLDGFIPLAWGLNDAKLKQRAQERVDAILKGQRADGWYAPFPADASSRAYDMWAILLVNKVLTQNHEATRDPAVLKAMERNLKAMLDTLDRTPLFGWGKARWFEGLIPVYYVYEQTGEAWLLDLARKLHAQGFNYGEFFKGEEIKSPTPRRGLWTMEKHVVNAAMAIKAGAMAWRLTRSEQERALPREMLAVLDQFHGQATGMFAGDECLSGRNPLQGTELCAVVEAMYSLELCLAMTGDPAFGDRLEQVAFNALPGTFSPDMWTHQYVQQTNQVQCTINQDQMWSTNGPDSNIFGLEPNFGCCTSNMHQGWPKLTSHLWMAAPQGGIAAMAYAPSRVRFNSRGTDVEVALATDYPFREDLSFTITPTRPSRFPLFLRIPAWAKGATVSVAGGAARAVKPGTFHRVERQWESSTQITLRLPMQPAVTRRYNHALSISRGPLVYSLKIGEGWKRVNEDKPHRELPHGDFEIRPTTPWNYGLVLDEKNPAASVRFEEQPIGEKPFAPEGAGVQAFVKGRRLPNWKMAHGWAGEVPPQPQSSKEPVEELTLLPYGCTRLRVTEFPRLG